MKHKSPISPGAPKVKPWGLKDTEYERGRPGLWKSDKPLPGNLNVGYPTKFASVGGKTTKPGAGVGSTVTMSSRRADEIDRSSIKTPASWRSDAIREDARKLTKSHVGLYDFKPPKK